MSWRSPVFCNIYILYFSNTGRWNLRWFRPTPPGRLPLPPAGHSNRPLLQVQVQQRRRRPVANLNPSSEPEWAAMGSEPTFVSFSDSCVFSPSPTSFKCFIFWQSLHQPLGVTSTTVALHELKGMVELRHFTFATMQVQSLRSENVRLDWGLTKTSVDDGGGLRLWRKTERRIYFCLVWTSSCRSLCWEEKQKSFSLHFFVA